ncbi:MAG TPA: outer membrane beta-barrel protein [Polyangiaceae bacterium]
MSRSFPALVVFGAVAFARYAQAQGECPEGDWFCEETAATPADASEAPAAGSPDAAAGTGVNRPQPTEPADAGSRVVVARPGETPEPPKRRHHRRFGVNARLQGVVMGDDDDRHPDAGMGGIGASFRYRPIPYFAFDAALDFFGGRDFQGFERREAALLLSALVFFNPQHRVQATLLGGFGWSAASVDVEPRPGQAVFASYEADYRYFGAHLGPGVEVLISRSIGVNAEFIGFIRTRTDRGRRRLPEFVDPDTGRATNTSGGGLFRVGASFYF